ncbi:MAG: helix-turn-helix domain-containing protein [bacterium]
MSTKDPLLSPPEAAEYLGLKKGTLDTWRSQGRHPELWYIKVGSKVRYPLSALQEWLKSRTVSP